MDSDKSVPQPLRGHFEVQAGVSFQAYGNRERLRADAASWFAGRGIVLFFVNFLVNGNLDFIFDETEPVTRNDVLLFIEQHDNSVLTADQQVEVEKETSRLDYRVTVEDMLDVADTDEAQAANDLSLIGAADVLALRGILRRTIERQQRQGIAIRRILKVLRFFVGGS